VEDRDRVADLSNWSARLAILSSPSIAADPRAFVTFALLWSVAEALP
jgi:hypothetical protein